ncbi:hypothetical protein RFI_26620, partial [Reticulomyxa filosa]
MYRYDSSYAILRFRQMDWAMQRHIRKSPWKVCNIPDVAKASTRYQILYLQYGYIWQFKALPLPPSPFESERALANNEIVTKKLLTAKDSDNNTPVLTKEIANVSKKRNMIK